MSQFLANSQDIDDANATALLRGEEAHHLARVVRAREGSRVRLFDGAGRRWEGVIARIGREDTRVERLTPLPANEPAHQLVVAAGLIKADRWEWLLEKAVELGATAVIPLACERSQYGAAEAQGKTARWEKIILAAAKQCERGIVPELRKTLTVEEYAGSLPPLEGSEGRWLLAARAEGVFPAPSGGAAALAAGPEGGFAEGEEKALRAAGFTPATLGERVLRSETAVLAALAFVGRSEKIER